MLLKVENVTVIYRKAIALSDINLYIDKGEIVSVIGSNGAGKSTLLKAIVGRVPLRKGSIYFRDIPIHNKMPWDVVRLGIGIVPEGRRLFPELTVQENLLIGSSGSSNKGKLQEKFNQVFELFPILYEKRNEKVKALSGGQQQMVAIGRALMKDLLLLCLDEPSLGLAPIIVETLGETIKEMRKIGMSILLIEQNAYLALEVANRCYALQTGKIVFEGIPEEAIKRGMLHEIYFGKKA